MNVKQRNAFRKTIKENKDAPAAALVMVKPDGDVVVELVASDNRDPIRLARFLAAAAMEARSL